MVGGVRIEFGEGALGSLAELVAELGGRRVLVVTDTGVRMQEFFAPVVESLAGEVETVQVFDGVDENPTTEHVEAGAAVARRLHIDFLVGLGGGSAMDTAKGVNFLLTNGGRMEDYQGSGRAAEPMLPSIGVPTTAGTGSEAQSYALIASADTHRKMACGDPKARFRAVILDPTLTASVPRRVAVATGIDAIAHAVESHVSRARNPISAMYSRQAWRLLSDSFATSLGGAGVGEAGDADSDDSFRSLGGAGEAGRADSGGLAGTAEIGDARAGMLLGAHLAGAAIEASMLGAAHACANPLTARYGLNHGVAVGLMLPHVVRFNREVAAGLYAELDADLPARLEQLWTLTSLPARLRDHGVEQRALAELAADAVEQWTAGFNPRAVEERDLLTLYEHAY